MVSYMNQEIQNKFYVEVLILIVVEDGLVQKLFDEVEEDNEAVLILIVVEDGLVLITLDPDGRKMCSLNPYCSGRWSRTLTDDAWKQMQTRLNPYCSGRWSRTLCLNCYCKR